MDFVQSEDRFFHRKRVADKEGVDTRLEMMADDLGIKREPYICEKKDPPAKQNQP